MNVESNFIKKNIPGTKSYFDVLPLDHPLYKTLNGYKDCYTINHLSTAIFGVNQKRFRKLLQANFTRTVNNETILNEELWLFFKVVQKFIPNLEESYYFLISKDLSKFNYELISSLMFLLQKDKNELISKKQSKKILDLFFIQGKTSAINESIPLIYHALGRQMYKVESFLYKKHINKLVEDNKELKLKLSLNRKQNIYLTNQEFLLKLKNKNIMDFTIKVPLFNHDLINMGLDLHLCVGDGFYAEKVLNNQSNILVLEQNKTPVIVLELIYNQRLMIIQAKKLFNKDVDMSLLIKIQEQLLILF